jgi:hypothetical protein
MKVDNKKTTNTKKNNFFFDSCCNGAAFIDLFSSIADICTFIINNRKH